MTSNRRRIAAQRKNSKSGSPSPEGGELSFVAVAKLRRPHGLDGEALVSILSDFPERIVPGAKFFLGEEHVPITVESIRGHNEGLLLRIVELPNRLSLEGKQNQIIYAHIDDLPSLEEGDYYHHQLIGLEIKDTDGMSLGKLVDILVTGANDVYVVRPEKGKELLLPSTKEVIIEINLPKGFIVAKMIPGLLE